MAPGSRTDRSDPGCPALTTGGPGQQRPDCRTVPPGDPSVMRMETLEDAHRHDGARPRDPGARRIPTERTGRRGHRPRSLMRPPTSWAPLAREVTVLRAHDTPSRSRYRVPVRRGSCTWRGREGGPPAGRRPRPADCRSVGRPSFVQADHAVGAGLPAPKRHSSSRMLKIKESRQPSRINWV